MRRRLAKLEKAYKPNEQEPPVFPPSCGNPANENKEKKQEIQQFYNYKLK